MTEETRQLDRNDSKMFTFITERQMTKAVSNKRGTMIESLNDPEVWPFVVGSAFPFTAAAVTVIQSLIDAARDEGTPLPEFLGRSMKELMSSGGGEKVVEEWMKGEFGFDEDHLGVLMAGIGFVAPYCNAHLSVMSPIMDSSFSNIGWDANNFVEDMKRYLQIVQEVAEERFPFWSKSLKQTVEFSKDLAWSVSVLVPEQVLELSILVEVDKFDGKRPGFSLVSPKVFRTPGQEPICNSLWARAPINDRLDGMKILGKLLGGGEDDE